VLEACAQLANLVLRSMADLLCLHVELFQQCELLEHIAFHPEVVLLHLFNVFTEALNALLEK
jgi:hypothetical protein